MVVFYMDANILVYFLSQIPCLTVCTTSGEIYNYAEAYEKSENRATKYHLNLQFDIVNAHSQKFGIIRRLEEASQPPYTTQIQRFRAYVDDELRKYMEKPRKSFSYKKFVEFSMLAMVRITLYNLRHSSEVASMSVKQFQDRTAGS